MMHSDTLTEVLELMRTSLEKGEMLPPEEFTADDILFLYEMGYQLYQVGDYEKGEEVFKRLVIAKPGEPKFWQGLASSLQMRQKFDEALVPWSMYCIIDPKAALPHYHAAECLIALHQLEEAKKALLAAEIRDEAKEFSSKIALFREVWNLGEV